MNRDHKDKAEEKRRREADKDKTYTGYIRHGSTEKARAEFRRPAHERYLSKSKED